MAQSGGRLDNAVDKHVMKRILMIAYHFPPIRVSSGIQRTLKFVQYLQNHDWQALVLSIDPRTYEKVSDDQMHEIPENTVVKRVWACDTAKHLSIAGRYFNFMALPDRWVSWCIGGTFSGLRLIRQYRPQILWSTYPIASAHLLGLILHRLSGLPWVADFRDPMSEQNYPSDPSRRRAYRWIERHVLHHCTRAVFTTPGAIRMYSERYPDIPLEHWVLIPNGYDEENFQRAEQKCSEKPAAHPLILLHSGVLYPTERDPSQFLRALANLKQRGLIQAEHVKIILRATGHDNLHAQSIAALDLQDLIELAPGIAYEDALAEMLSVDGLLIFQAANCNHQIPAKLYEYLRARKPILGLTDPQGDTAQVLLEAGFRHIAPLDNAIEIEQQLLAFIDGIRQNSIACASDAEIQRHSRQSRSEQMAHLLADL
jgi:glycosyltransferase involved in cell wall biosynthesis